MVHINKGVAMKRGWENLLHGVVAGLVLPAVASVYPQAAAAYDRTGELQNRLEKMQEEMRALQQELQDMRAVDDAQQKQMEDTEARDTSEHKALEERVTKVETTPPARQKKNLVFFRGGYVEAVGNFRGFESFTDTHDTLGLGPLLGTPFNDSDDGWYVGGAIEHSLTSDLWGLWPGTEALGEISLEFKRFGSERATIVVPTAECALFQPVVGADCIVVGDTTLTMFTVSASPKIKFMEGSKLRPWIIPAGLDFHVISPPSDAATVLDIGVQFGAGVEYEFVPGMKFGIDGRYHLASDETNTNNDFVPVFRGVTGIPVTGDTDHDNDFWTIGGYLGFTF